jgi:hypothetical protein
MKHPGRDHRAMSFERSHDGVEASVDVDRRIDVDRRLRSLRDQMAQQPRLQQLDRIGPAIANDDRVEMPERGRLRGDPVEEVVVRGLSVYGQDREPAALVVLCDASGQNAELGKLRPARDRAEPHAFFATTAYSLSR